MAITKIYIRKEGGAVEQTDITTSPVLSRSTGVDLHVDGTSTEVSLPVRLSGGATYIEAYERIMRVGYISRINSAYAGDDGNLSILPGDGCLSWRAVNDDGYIRMCDMCQPCNNCNEYARIKAYYEALRINLNSLKDVNIYDNKLMASRREALLAERMNQESEGMESCVYNDEYGRIKSLNSIRLLKQYIALVHMWNWLAFMGRIKTDIQAQNYNDTHYLHIQSHFVIPSCDVPTVTCNIEITAGDGTTDTMKKYASVYAEVREVRYDALSNHGDSVTTNSAITHISPLNKTITATLSGIEKAGTCIVYVSICPFYYASQDSVLEPITTETEEPEYDTNGKLIRYKVTENLAQPFSGHIPITRLEAATKEQLESGMRVEPSTTSPGSATWSIAITWTVTTTHEDETQSTDDYVSTLYYELQNPTEPAAKTEDDVRKLSHTQITGINYRYPEPEPDPEPEPEEAQDADQSSNDATVQ